MFKIMSELSISKQNVYLNSCDVLVARRWLNAFVNKGNHNPSKCSTTSVHGCRYSRPHSCEWRTGKHHKHIRSQMSSNSRPHSCEWRTRKHHKITIRCKHMRVDQLATVFPQPPPSACFHQVERLTTRVQGRRLRGQEATQVADE